MDHYAGIDVSLESSSVCIVDAQGKIVKEAKVASEPRRICCNVGGGLRKRRGKAQIRPRSRTGSRRRWPEMG